MKHIEKIVIWMIAVLFVVIVIIATDFWLLWLPLEHSSEYPQKVAALFMALTAFVTLLVVYATFNATKQSNLREQQRREDELAKEERDRKEHLLNEITEWAEDVARLNFKIYNFIEAQIAKESWVESSIGEIVSQFQVVEAKGDYINTIALSSFKGKGKLLSAVKAVNKEIRELVDISMKRLDGKVATEAVTEHMNLLRSKITELLKETAKIKTRDIS